uniref:Uncharacterized protein n=1 Tax=Aeromonas hydrophila TaxID=644 RepID=A0A7G1KXT9_AERHY|nr:hypothetical protein [Aeromonas hydrophila]
MLPTKYNVILERYTLDLSYSNPTPDICDSNHKWMSCQRNRSPGWLDRRKRDDRLFFLLLACCLILPVLHACWYDPKAPDTGG